MSNYNQVIVIFEDELINFIEKCDAADHLTSDVIKTVVNTAFGIATAGFSGIGLSFDEDDQDGEPAEYTLRIKKNGNTPEGQMLSKVITAANLGLKIPTNSVISAIKEMYTRLGLQLPSQKNSDEE